MTYIVSSGALNSTHSLLLCMYNAEQIVSLIMKYTADRLINS